MLGDWRDLAQIDLALDSRAASFENPEGARGVGGSLKAGRKGRPARTLRDGQTHVLADIEGPGTVRHIWLTVPPTAPERLRALVLEVFYDGADEPSISVPCLDFFGLPHGRAVPFTSALTAAHEGRGFNAYLPLPFRNRVRIELANHSDQPTVLYYQVDYTLEPRLSDELGLLHATFRRENPTVMQRDFAIADGLRGPGRFLGCNVGIRTLPAEHFSWYGEGEVKMYRDGDRELPTICGTGLEDYVGSAWGMGPHSALFAGAPLEVADPAGGPVPALVGFFRWHVPDPVVFARELRVTIQQIGFAQVPLAALESFESRHPVAGRGWLRDEQAGVARGIAERVDDYCATAYIYCREPQPVPRVDVAAAVADIERLPEEPLAAGGGMAGTGG